MGWTFFMDHAALTPGQILIREMSGKNDTGAEWSIIDHATRGNEWYAICKFTAPGQNPIFYGLVCLFKRSKKSGEFGYKDMSEACGPNASNAPKRIIDQLEKLAPIDPATMTQSGQWARQWRDRCLANAKRKPAPAIKPGDIVKFANNAANFELIGKAGPRRGWHVRMVGGSGMLYRATARQIANCQIIGGQQ
jgi:hypothetical protein